MDHLKRPELTDLGNLNVELIWCVGENEAFAKEKELIRHYENPGMFNISGRPQLPRVAKPKGPPKKRKNVVRTLHQLASISARRKLCCRCPGRYNSGDANHYYWVQRTYWENISGLKALRKELRELPIDDPDVADEMKAINGELRMQRACLSNCQSEIDDACRMSHLFISRRVAHGKLNVPFTTDEYFTRRYGFTLARLSSLHVVSVFGKAYFTVAYRTEMKRDGR